jgi:hypothetical protein
MGSGVVQNLYVISSGTSIAPKCETVRSAAKALELALEYMRQRLPNVTVENADGEQLSYFQLKGLAQAESRKENAVRAQRRAPGACDRDSPSFPMCSTLSPCPAMR